jgi:hypothetical protein
MLFKKPLIDLTLRGSAKSTLATAPGVAAAFANETPPDVKAAPAAAAVRNRLRLHRLGGAGAVGGAGVATVAVPPLPVRDTKQNAKSKISMVCGQINNKIRAQKKR